MVQTDISQLSAECTDWRQILRSYREEFNDCKKALQEVCRHSLTKDQLQDVEHFHNQFHIQLINIHDLKQSIKFHDRKIQFEKENPSESAFAEHEHLLNEFISLENTLQELRNEFREFINRVSC